MVDPNAAEEQSPQRLKPKAKTAERVSGSVFVIFLHAKKLYGFKLNLVCQALNYVIHKSA